MSGEQDLCARIVAAESDHIALDATDGSFLMRVISLTLPDETFAALRERH